MKKQIQFLPAVNIAKQFNCMLATSKSARAFCLMALMLLTIAAGQAATIFWDGSSSSNWATASNWQGNTVPGPGDIVAITSGVPNSPILSSTASIKTLLIGTGGSLEISVNGTLNISGSSGVDGDGIYVGGILTNWGTIDIFNVEGNGIENDGTFINETGAAIFIDKTGTFGEGIWNLGGVFTNKGDITIGETNAVQRSGIHLSNGATFNNMAAGDIIIHKANAHGLSNSDGSTFNNNGNITIGETQNIGGIGISNGGGSNFNNNDGGAITIHHANQDGIQIGNGTFTNEGHIALGENGTFGNGYSALRTFLGTFLNNTCNASIHIYTDRIHDQSNKFTNNGLIIEEGTENSDIQTNNGIVVNFNGGNFNIGSGNPAMVLNSIGDKLWIGCSTNWGNSDNWYPSGIPGIRRRCSHHFSNPSTYCCCCFYWQRSIHNLRERGYLVE